MAAVSAVIAFHPEIIGRRPDARFIYLMLYVYTYHGLGWQEGERMVLVCPFVVRPEKSIRLFFSGTSLSSISRNEEE
jgi:hypothetical protein